MSADTVLGQFNRHQNIPVSVRLGVIPSVLHSVSIPPCNPLGGGRLSILGAYIICNEEIFVMRLFLNLNVLSLAYPLQGARPHLPDSKPSPWQLYPIMCRANYKGEWLARHFPHNFAFKTTWPVLHPGVKWSGLAVLLKHSVDQLYIHVL